MAKTIRLRAVNFEPVLGDKPATAVKIKAVIEQAAHDRRSVVIDTPRAITALPMPANLAKLESMTQVS